MIWILHVILFSVVGFVIGMITSLFPGLHVNTLSLLICSFPIPFLFIAEDLLGADPMFSSILLSVTIVSICITHTFMNIIPATFMGAPEEDVALALLPAHSLLKKGRGYEAIALSALGSFGSTILTIALILPMKFLLSDPINLYDAIRSVMVWVIVIVIIVMIITEKNFKAMLCSLAVMLLSGIYGIIILQLPISSPLGLPSSPLFPSLAGLFGLSTLLSSILSGTRVIDQDLAEPTLSKSEKRLSILSIFTGSLSGIFVSIVPGITTAIGTVIALTLRGRVNEQQSIVTLSSVNTSASIMAIANLFIIQKARSGVALMVENLVGVERWEGFLPPFEFLILLIPTVISASLSLPLTCYLGKRISKRIGKINYQNLMWFGVVFILSLVFIFSGCIGLAIMLTGSAIGLLPILLGARRSSCMGVLLIPLVLHFLVTS